MGEILRLVPNPSGDRKVLEFEDNLLDLMEQCYEGLASASRSIRWLSTHVLEDEPLERAVLQSLVAHADEEIPKFAKLLAAVRKRRATIQKSMKANTAIAPRRTPTPGRGKGT